MPRINRDIDYLGHQLWPNKYLTIRHRRLANLVNIERVMLYSVFVMLMVPPVLRIGIHIYAFDPFFFGVVLLWMIRMGPRRLIQHWSRLWHGHIQVPLVDILLIALLGWSLLSVLLSVDMGNSFIYWLLLFRGVVFYFYIRSNWGNTLRDIDMRRIVVFLLVIELIIALVQLATNTRLGSLNDIFGEQDVYANAYFYTPFGKIIRVVGTFHNPNLLADWILILAPFVWVEIYLGIAPRKRTYLLIAGLSVLILLATFSRSGWATLFVMTIVVMVRPLLSSKRQMGIFLWKAVRYGIVFAVIFLLAFLLFEHFSSGNVFVIIQSRLANVSSGSEWRAGYIDLALQFIRRFPLVGVGIGSFGKALAAQAGQIELPSILIGSEHFSMVHNVYLLFASETGIPGAIIWLTLTLTVLAQLWLLFARRLPQNLKGFSLWLLAAWLGIAFNSNFEAVFFHQSIHMLIFTIIGLEVAHQRIAKTSRGTSLRLYPQNTIS